MSYIIHIDTLFWPFLKFLEAGDLSSQRFKYWISTQFSCCTESFQRVYSEGWKRIDWGLPLWTLNEPPMNPQWTLSELRTDKVWIQWTHYWKRLQLHTVFLPSRKFRYDFYKLNMQAGMSSIFFRWGRKKRTDNLKRNISFFISPYEVIETTECLVLSLLKSEYASCPLPMRKWEHWGNEVSH